MFKVTGLLWLVLKRQWHYPGLAALALLGVILTVGLLTSASFFSQAVDQVLLGQQLAEVRRITGRPPFAAQIYTLPSAQRPLSLADAEKLAGDISAILAAEVGLPLKHGGLQIDSGGMMLRPAGTGSPYGEAQAILDTVSLVYMEDIAGQMEIVEGSPFNTAPSGEMLEVWMHASLAQQMGVQVGEQFKIGLSLATAPIPIRLSGVWQPRDPQDLFWFNDPDMTLVKTLLVRREDYIRHVEPLVASKARLVYWYIVLDDTGIVPARSPDYIAGFDRSLAIINKFLPRTSLNAPSIKSLEEFVRREQLLTLTLLGFNIPAFGILLYFLSLISTMITHWQRREIAVLMSRGMSLAGILGMILLEALLLFALGYPLGVGFGMLLAWGMGYTDSFLAFTPREALPVSLQGLSIPLSLLALAIALLARLWPAIQASRQSVVGQERAYARPQGGPFWYRHYLDLLLIPPAYYAYDQLADRGSLVLLVRSQPEDLFRDPLLILAPALFMLALTLVFMRGFVWVMRLIDHLAGFTPWLALHLALRQLGRQSQRYINPLLVVILSLALGVYLLSMAASLDQWLIDRIYYRVGADLTFEPYRETAEGTVPFDGEWIPLRETFLALPGVAAATKIGDYPAKIDLSPETQVRGRFLALDRLSFPTVGWFRYDFTEETLGGLMNRLAASPDNILVSKRFLAQHNLRVGDKITINVTINTALRAATLFTIAGTYTYFPTVYEENGVTIIGNLDYFTYLFGFMTPHQVWLGLHDHSEGETLVKLMPRQLGFQVMRPLDSRALIEQERARLERVGVFGTLSTGFLASVSMAALGLLINSYTSLRERLHQFAVLYAVGVRRQHFIGQVILEHLFLLAYGAAAGTFIGMLASELFVPFFRVTGEQGLPLPPLLPLIERDAVWNLTASLILTIILVEMLLTTLVLYRRLVALLRVHWG